MKRLNRHKGESKKIRGTEENAILSNAHLSKTDLSGSNLSKALVPGARLRRAKRPGAEIARANLSNARPLETKRIHIDSAIKKLTHDIEFDSKHLVNCGRCSGLLECNNHILCDINEAEQEFMVLCDNCKTELINYGVARTEIDKILREMDEGQLELFVIRRRGLVFRVTMI